MQPCPGEGPKPVPRRNLRFRDFQMITITALIYGMPGTALTVLRDAAFVIEAS